MSSKSEAFCSPNSSRQTEGVLRKVSGFSVTRLESEKVSTGSNMFANLALEARKFTRLSRGSPGSSFSIITSHAFCIPLCRPGWCEGRSEASSSFDPPDVMFGFQMRPTRIFPDYSSCAEPEPKRVTFGWAEVAIPSDDSRISRANSRRTHSARDSSSDSLDDCRNFPGPKRNRTNESNIVEDAEIRYSTSSARHRKPSLHHSTPAEPSVNIQGSVMRCLGAGVEL